MKICFLSPLVPSVAYGHRPYSFLKELAALGHSITLHCLDDPGPVSNAAVELDGMGIDVRPFSLGRARRWANCLIGLPTKTPLRVLHCRSQAFAERVHRDLAQGGYDIAHVDRFRLAPYAVGARDSFSGPIVLDFPDALSLYYERAVKNPRHFLKKWVDRREHLTIPRYEKKILQANLTPVVCSNLDRDCLLNHSSESDIPVIPNMVDTEEFHPRSRGNGRTQAVFTGTLYYLPNIDGLLWLKEKVVPLLEGRDLPIEVIGFGATSELDSLKEHGRFRMTGYVENMAEHLYRDDIYLCPLRVGAGIRFKLLEAFAAGMATVSTTLGYEGIPCEPGKHLLVADTPEEFAQAIAHLMEHPEEKTRIGERARQFVLETYSSKATAKQLETLYTNLLTAG